MFRLPNFITKRELLFFLITYFAFIMDFCNVTWNWVAPQKKKK